MRSTAAIDRPSRSLTAEALQGDLIQESHPLFGLIWINQERMSGAPCFTGTRVPVKNLFDYLEGGYSLNQFLDDFEGVTCEQAVGVIALAGGRLRSDLPMPTEQGNRPEST